MKTKGKIVLLCTCFVMFITRHKIQHLLQGRDKDQCPNILKIMTTGRWLPHRMTEDQMTDIDKFLDSARESQGIPKSLERKDKRCGNVSMPGPIGFMFKALCNPKGETPCCYNTVCRQKTLEECQCSKCFDERLNIHAEYSKWIPKDPRCPIRYYNAITACKLLKDKTVLIVGDSYLRHLHTAFLALLRDNLKTGSLKINASNDVIQQCSGMYMYTEKFCRLQLDKEPKPLCSGTVSLIFKEWNRISSAQKFHRDVEDLTKEGRSTFVLCGIGMHAGLNAERIFDKFVQPALNIVKNRLNSHFLFATPHSPGNLKSDFLKQSNFHILKFISQIGSYLKPLDISIFNTFPMTQNMVSFDGNHYGLGINLQKVQFLLNYIQELRDNGRW